MNALTSSELHHLIEIGAVRIATSYKPEKAPAKGKNSTNQAAYMRAYRASIKENHPARWLRMLEDKARYMREYRQRKQNI